MVGGIGGLVGSTGKLGGWDQGDSSIWGQLGDKKASGVHSGDLGGASGAHGGGLGGIRGI